VLLFGITVTYFPALRCIDGLLGIDLGQQSGQVSTGESPLEGDGDLLVAILEAEQAISEFCQGGEVKWV
jgi:hypothetical protein